MMRRTCGDFARVLSIFAREAAGATCARLSLRPLFRGGGFDWHNPGATCRGKVGVWLEGA